MKQNILLIVRSILYLMCTKSLKICQNQTIVPSHSDPLIVIPMIGTLSGE